MEANSEQSAASRQATLEQLRDLRAWAQSAMEAVQARSERPAAGSSAGMLLAELYAQRFSTKPHLDLQCDEVWCSKVAERLW